MKSININNTTFTEITYRMEGEDLEGLLIHDENDTFHDGDMIVGCELPETVEEAEIILANETGISTFHIEDGMYIIE